MASITANGSKGHHKFTLTVSQKSQSVANNTSTVSFSFVLSPIKTGYDWSYTTKCVTAKCTINGATYTKQIYSYGGSGSVTLASGSLTVAHNSNGAKSISFSISVSDGINKSYTTGSASASGSMTLTTIPRVSDLSLSASSVAAGSSITATGTKKYSGFTDTIVLTFGSHSQTLTSGTAYTIPLSWLDAIPSATSGTATVTLTTKSGSTTIGTTSKTFTITAPSSVVPSLSIAVADAKGLFDTFGYYFVNYSQYAVTMTESTLYGATISSRSTVMNGETFTAKDPTSSAIGAVANNSIEATITDSRGRTATASLSSLATRIYATPVISDDISVIRCDSDGTENDSGDYCEVTATWTYDTIEKNGTAQNTSTGKLYYRQRTEDSYTDEKSVTITSGTAAIIPAPHTVSNYIKIAVSDTFSTAVGATPAVATELMISTPAKELSLKYGYQAAIGKSAEYGTADEPIFEIAWKTKTADIEADTVTTATVTVTDDILIDDSTLEAAWTSAFGS